MTDRPIFVLVPMNEWTETTLAGSMPISEPDRFQPEVVGILEGISADDDDAACLKLNADLMTHGVRVAYFVRATKSKPGWRGAEIIHGVLCGTIEQAQALPGFTHVYMHNGPFSMLPANAARITPERVFETGFDRRPLGENTPEEYGDDDAAMLSFLPMGQLGYIVFLKEDPQFFYTFTDIKWFAASRADLVGAARSECKKIISAAAAD